MSTPSRSSIPAVISAMSGVVLFALVCVGVGFLIGHKRIWPHYEIREAGKIMRSLMIHGEAGAHERRNLAPPGAAREPAVLHDAGASVGSGHYALMGWDNARAAYSVWLYDGNAQLVHTWPVDEMAISDKAQHRQNAPHAMEVLSDGTLLVSFDWLGLVARLDACGTALWSREGFYHHSFSPAADGGIWTWYGENSGYGQIQDILKFDPMTGEDMMRIDFNNDVVMRDAASAVAFALWPGFEFTPDDQNPLDIFHPNDVEELSAALAPAFPQFAAGDLLISLRELNMVAVLDQSGAMKWYQTGPWLKQHDPDFEPDGRISIFNNGVMRTRSTIMTVDPGTGAVEDALLAFDGPFYSQFRGKHQRLPNGNRLVTIPEQGQAVEVAANGTVAVEFNNVVPGDPRYNDDLVNVKWMPDGFFQSLPSCSN